MEKLKNGEIDAVIAVEGKPLQEIAQIAGENLHLVPVNYEKALQADYLPEQFTAEDYPNLIAAGQEGRYRGSLGGSGRLQLGAAHRPIPSLDTFRRCILLQSYSAATKPFLKLCSRLHVRRPAESHPTRSQAVLDGFIRSPARVKW